MNDRPIDDRPINDGAEPVEYRQLRFRPPEGAATLLLVRHGESAAARDDLAFELVDGHGDPPLHPEGRKQADALADRLGSLPISTLYVTTLRRTVETAAPLASRLGLSPTVERDLREVYLGEWEGERYRKQMSERGPMVRQLIEEERWDAIPGAEPAGEFSARVEAAIRRIAAAHPDELVAVFTHGGVIGQVLALAAKSRPFAFVSADNGSISELVVAGDRWIIRRYNDTAHLETADLTASG